MPHLTCQENEFKIEISIYPLMPLMMTPRIIWR